MAPFNDFIKSFQSLTVMLSYTNLNNSFADINGIVIIPEVVIIFSGNFYVGFMVFNLIPFQF